ncbi:MAG: 2-dehydropantoate 2-reductase [Planctomycetaceae bacterium]|nr:2-dehydropantoate 2-reductase [Planctomycetaceae bacterium]
MKILMIGAGALGGYFGARLAAAGRDVTFLVRPRRRSQIEATGGLVVESPAGDLHIKDPQLVTADEIADHYDLVIVTCKAYDLDSCIADFAPAVGPATLILPVLNGLRHMDVLIERFGKDHILGGRGMIFATLGADGRILHQAPLAALDYGEIAGGTSPRIEMVDTILSGAGFEARLRQDIMQDLWDKHVLIATVAGSTSLMRATIGDINRAGGLEFMQGLLAENASIAKANNHRPSEEFLSYIRSIITNPDSTQMASLAKDMDKGGKTEADHIFGDLINRAPSGADLSRLRTVYLCSRAYETRRQRENLPLDEFDRANALLDAGDGKAAIELFKQVADKTGRLDAMHSVAHTHLYGVGGVAKDYDIAFAWFTKAANNGCPQAMYHLGMCNANGYGTSVDKAAAAAWYRKSAERGDEDAMYELAKRLETGDGVPIDMDEALHWYREAAGHGQKAAVERLQDLEA